MSAKRERRLVPHIQEWTRGEAEPPCIGDEPCPDMGTPLLVWIPRRRRMLSRLPRCGEVRYLGEFENTAPATRKLVSRLTEKYDHLHICYAQRGKPPR